MSVKRPQLLIAIDVGNSRVKVGLFPREANDAPASPPAQAGATAMATSLPECLHATASSSRGEIPWSGFVSKISRLNPSEVRGIIAGANPEGVARVAAEWPTSDWGIPQILTQVPGDQLEVTTDEPGKVGIDRLLNAVAANLLRLPSSPAIIVDTGTATTVDLVSSRGAFDGGAILPGFELSARSLHLYTALLPNIPIEELASESHLPLGKNTRAALRSGLFWGQLGAVRELVSRLSDIGTARVPERGPAAAVAAPLVLLTGGGASLLAPEMPQARWEPFLCLQGLVLVASRIAR